MTLLVLTRRLVLLVALMFWQGGFLFYAGVVVPVGAEVLGSHAAQGWIKRVVTNYLNVGGVLALALWMWDLTASRVGRIGWILWALLAIQQAGLLGLHVALDGLLDPVMQHIRERPTFYSLHRWYLILSGLQWLLALALTLLTLVAWHRAGTSQSGQARD